MNAYLVLDLTIHDMESFAEYVEKIPAVISNHGGKYAVQGQIPTVLEGDWKPERLVVIEFPSRDNAKEFLARSRSAGVICDQAAIDYKQNVVSGRILKSVWIKNRRWKRVESC